MSDGHSGPGAPASTIDAVQTSGAVGLLDPNFYVDIDGMHEAFRQWRADGPLHRDGPTGLLALTQHGAVSEVEQRARDFVSSQGYRSFVSPDEDNIIALDDPDHAAQRRLVNRRFTPRAVREMEPAIRSVVTELVDAMVEQGRIDVVRDLAAPLPARLTAHLLGFPEEMWPDIRSWSERLMRIDGLPHSQAAAMDVVSACEEYGSVLKDLVADRRSCPVDDVLSVWANGGMSNRTIFYETGLFISGGAETTRTVIARGLRELCRHPDQWERLAAEPATLPVAVEELIRWVSPLNNMFRTAAHDTALRDWDVRQGDRLILLYPSANRDEQAFTDPFSFDTRRSPNNHLAFGFGAHFCLGASLARLELRILLQELTSRITALEPMTEPDIEPNVFVGAVRSFELGFRPR